MSLLMTFGENEKEKGIQALKLGIKEYMGKPLDLEF